VKQSIDDDTNGEKPTKSQCINISVIKIIKSNSNESNAIRIVIVFKRSEIMWKMDWSSQIKSGCCTDHGDWSRGAETNSRTEFSLTRSTLNKYTPLKHNKSE